MGELIGGDEIEIEGKDKNEDKREKDRKGNYLGYGVERFCWSL